MTTGKSRYEICSEEYLPVPRWEVDSQVLFTPRPMYEGMARFLSSSEPRKRPSFEIDLV